MSKDTTDLKDGWRGVLATFLMANGATAISWSLFLGLASVGDPEGYAKFSRPSYLE